LLVFAILDSVEEIEVMVPQGGNFEFWFRGKFKFIYKISCLIEYKYGHMKCSLVVVKCSLASDAN
jgi:hypothetical protein